MPIIRDFNKDLVPMDNPIEARKNDLIRITEWLASPAGLKFAGKQALLRASAGNSSKNRADLLANVGKGATDAASAIAVILAQIPVSGTGTHFLFNELSSLAFQNTSFYANNRFAATQANYKGVITISANKDGEGKREKNRFRGSKTWDEQGFAPTGESDEIGLKGVLNNKDDATKNLIVKDTLPIVFSIVDEPDSTLIFRGFIQGLSDSFSANWSAYQYVGRGEPMYTYTGGTRGISYTMMIPVFSAKEQKPTYRKLNSLLSYTYPKYVNNLPQGTVAKMRIGDYISCYGVITSMNATVGQDVPWSTPESEYIDGVEVPVQRILPQVINLTISINIIHERLPERELDNRPRYIGNQALLGLASVTTTGVENEQFLEDGQ